MYCYHCGKEVEESDAYCQHCGTKLMKPVTVAAEVAVQQPAVQETAPLPAKKNVLAIIGFSFCFAAFLSSIAVIFIGDMMVFALGFGISGLVMSIIGLVRNKRFGKNATYRAFSITGIVLNAVALAITAIMILLYAIAILYAISFLWLMLFAL